MIFLTIPAFLPEHAWGPHEAFLVLFFSYQTTFCIIFLLLLLFIFLHLHRIISDKQATDLTLGCLEISSTKEICSLLFHLASGMFLSLGQKGGRFFTKVSQE